MHTSVSTKKLGMELNVDVCHCVENRVEFGRRADDLDNWL